MNYQFAKSIGSQNNIFMGLIHLFQNNKLNEYIMKFPNLRKIVNPLNIYESFDTVGIIDALFKVCTSELFELFKILYSGFSIFIDKNTRNKFQFIDTVNL